MLLVCALLCILIDFVETDRLQSLSHARRVSAVSIESIAPAEKERCTCSLAPALVVLSRLRH